MYQKYLQYILFFTILYFALFAQIKVHGQTQSAVVEITKLPRNPTASDVPGPDGTKPSLWYNTTTGRLWGWSGNLWKIIAGDTYIDLDPSPTNEKIVSFLVVAGMLRINENGVFYNVPINDIIAAANISSSSPTITVTNVGGVVTVTSADPDEDATNECNTSLSVTANNLSLADGCNTLTVPVTAIAPIQTIVAGAGISASTIAGTTTISAPAAWRLDGNAGTDGGATNFIGTTDAKDFVIKTNGAEIARFGQQGNAAFGSNLTNIDPSLIAPFASNIGSIAFQSGQATGAFGTAFHLAIASGDGSMAWGTTDGSQQSTTASGGSSTAWGVSTTASGDNSTAFGESTVASGINSLAFGQGNIAPSFIETTIGSHATNYTPISSSNFNVLDRLFTIGNGLTSLTRNNALTIWKDGRAMWNGDVAKQNTWIGVNGTLAQNFINVTTPTGSLAAISTEHTPSGNYAILGSNAGNSGLVINDTKQFVFTTTAGTSSTNLGATTTIANYGSSGVFIGGGASATSTLQIQGSVATAIFTNVAATLTLGVTHSTVIHKGAAATFTLPAAGTCTGRMYTVSNFGTGNVTFSLPISVANATTATILPFANGSNTITIQSDGTAWNKIGN